MSEKKYIGAEALIRLVAQLKAGFASLVHTHKLEDITDYTVDSALSSTSTNPVQNQALKSKFDEVESAITDKPDLSDLTSGDIVVKESEHASSATMADSAITANSATSATQDSNGNVISETYQTIANATSQHNALQSSIDDKVPTSRTINGKALTGNITLSASDVSAYSQTEIDSKVETINSAISGKEASGTAASVMSAHNTSTSAHNDIRELISGLTTRLNALANSTDEDLDQMAEIVAYIKSNKSLIDSITTSKVNVADIINNLTTNVTNKPLSAAQGVTIKALIDALQAEVNGKAAKATTLSGYGITDAYTKTQIDSTVSSLNAEIGGKANSSHTHPISDVINLQSELDALESAINNMTAGAPVFTDDGYGNVTLSNSTLDDALESIENGSY